MTQPYYIIAGSQPLLVSTAGTGFAGSVTTPSAVAALSPPAPYTNGSLAFSSTTGQTFQLRVGSALPVDGSSVLTATTAAGGSAAQWVDVARNAGQVSFLGNALSWTFTTIIAGTSSTVTGLSVPGAVTNEARPTPPPDWPAGVVLTAFFTSANTVKLVATNNSGASATIPTASTDVYTIRVYT